MYNYKGMAKKLGKRQKAAWASMVFANGSLTKQIDRRLAEAGVVQLDVYDLLLNLEESSGRKLKMSDLAERALITRSGLTRVVDRLEKQGLVVREACSQDRRAVYAALTPKGLAERERAWIVYESALQELFAAKLDDDDALSLVTLLKRFIPETHPLTALGIHEV